MKHFYTFLACLFASIQVSAQSSTLKGDSLIILPKKAPLNLRIKLVEKLRSSSSPLSEKQYHFTPKDRQIDYTRPTVKIPYSINTTPSGAFLTTVPIATIPKAHFAPTISIDYNSQSAYGVLGNGWSISGISSVNWCNTSWFYDKEVKAIQFSKSWRAFSLDGVRLVKAKENKYSAQFTTDQGFTFVKFRAGSNGDSSSQHPQVFFKAYSPNGQVAQYSNIAQGGKVYSPFTNAPVQEIRDKLGYSIRFEYETFSGNELRPPYIKSIRYGAKANETAPYSLEFEYIEDNSPKPFRSIWGVNYREDRLLKRIYSKKGSQVFRVYEFSYQYLDGEYFLESINCSSEGEELNPLEFSYNQEYKTKKAYSLKESDYGISWSGLNSEGQKLVPIRGHFSNKDFPLSFGISDKYNEGLVVHQAFNPYGIIGQWRGEFEELIIDVYGSECDKDEPILVYPHLGSKILTNKTITAEEGFQTIQAVDTNGDGIDELVKVNLIGVDRTNTIVQLSKYENLGSEKYKSVTKKFPIEGVADYFGGEFQYVHFQKTLWGDFFGNGKTMLLLITPNITVGGNAVGSRQSLIDLEHLNLEESKNLFDCEFEDLRNIYAIDIDADGKTDVCYWKDNLIKVYSYQHNTLKHIKTIYWPEKRRDVERYFADINNDGYIDILCPPAGNTKSWAIYLNTQGANTNILVRQEQEIVQVLERTECSFIDVNRDNFIDLLVNDKGKLSVYLNNKGTFQNKPSSTQLINSKNNTVVPLPIVPMSLGYNGGASSLIVLQGDNLNAYSFSEDCSKDKLLHNVYDSFGLLTEVKYTNAFESTMTEAYSDNEDYLKVKLPLNTIKTLKQYDNKGRETKDFYYSYFDPTLHRLGLGFCGFKKTITEDILNGQRLTRHYNPYMRGVLLEDEQYNLKERKNLSKVSYSYNEHHGSELSSALILLSKVFSEDFLNNTTTKTSFEYNRFGQATRVLKEYDDSNKEEQRTDYQFVYDSERYILGIPTKTRTTKYSTASGMEKSWAEVKAMTYNDSYTLLTGVKNYIGVNAEQLISEELLEYDEKGRVIFKTTIPQNRAVSLIQHYKYDGEYLTSFIDEKGLKTEYKEYDIYGNPQRVLDPRGNITDYLYDNWGRNLTRTYNNNYTGHRAFWQDGRIIREVYTGVLNEAMKLKGRQEYDILGRELKSGKVLFDNSILWTEKQYDKEGRLSKSSLAYKEGTAVQWANYDYDSYNRLERITYPSGKVEDRQYAPLEESITLDGITTKKKVNALGQLISSQDPGGVIQYKYRADGQIETTIAPNGAKTQFEYDECGRRVKLIDPSAGEQITRYTYHNDGYTSIENQNANGCTRAKYNAFGQLKYKDLGDGDKIEYLYNRYGDLVKVFRKDALNKSYRYDGWGRVIEQVQTIGAISYTEKYQYDKNELKQTTYILPSGKSIEESYHYQNDEHLKTYLKFNADSSQLVYELQELNAQGLPSKIKTGLLSRTYEYSNLGFPQKRTINYDNQVLQEQSYSFDPLRSNLQTRSFTLGGNTTNESFKYDELNRLVEQEGNSYLSSRRTYYNESACIVGTNGAGFGYYNREKPYQLTSIETYQYHSIHNLTENSESQNVSYTAYQRPKTITQGDKTASFSYDENGERVRMSISNPKGEVLDDRYYLGGRYESDKDKEVFYVDGNAYTAPVVLIKEAGDWKLYYIGRDYQGSITELIDEKGNLIEQYAYAPWGRRASLKRSVEHISDVSKSKLRRGYTGHEYLPNFGLINMNARLYDPYLGLFLSPDPYVQNPEFSQNFNRYIYCLNNPLKYTDKNGEFFLGTILTFAVDLFKTAFINGGLDPTSKTARERAWRKFDPTAEWSATNKAWKIDIGGFKTDPNRSIVERGLQLWSRWTRELPQTLLGNAASHSRNLLGQVDKVDYYGGATLVNDTDPSDNGHWGFTLGPYINSKNIVADPNHSEIFRYEYGHTLQSSLVGSLYLRYVGLPSLIGAGLDDKGLNDHNREWYETQANRMAFRYFSKYNSSSLAKLPWDDNEYPREYNPNWYWIFAHPSLTSMWWLFF